MSGDEAAWLVEPSDPANPGCVMAGMFLAAGPGGLSWAPSAGGALRLARREDAEALIAALGSLLGPAPGGAPLLATEHRWGPA